jgi:hypothetical protein
MPRSRSGRLLIQVEPGFKRKFYNALEAENLTLKDWFMSTARDYLEKKTRSSSVDEKSAEGGSL